MALAAPTSMRRFIILWSGQLFSLLGSGLTSFALAVWIFEQTGQATPFAITVLLGNLPALLLSPLAGSLADRWNRKTIMLLADTGSAAFTLLAASIVWFGSLEVWHIYLIAFGSSVFRAFQEPAYLAAIPTLVPKKDLPRANGLGQLSQAVEMMITPLLAGVLYITVGLRVIFIIDFLTYFAAIFTLLITAIPQPKAEASTEKSGFATLLADAKIGFGFLWQRPGLLTLLLQFSMTNFLLNLSMVLHGPMILGFSNAGGLGLVQTISGVGMLVGSIAMSAWGGPKNRIPAIIAMIAGAGLSIAIMGLRPNLLFPAIGFFSIMFMLPFVSGIAQTIFQIKVPLELQGRVMAVRIMISRALMPVAFAIAGPLADLVFEPLMQPEGLLGVTVIGDLLGTGTGRGIALLFILSGIGLAIISFVAFGNPRLRNLESEIPDAIPDEAAALPTEAVDLPAEAEPASS